MGNLPFSSISSFNGHFNGQGYTIANLMIDGNKEIDNNKYLGLFSTLSDASVENINFDGINVSFKEESNSYVGLLFFICR